MDKAVANFNEVCVVKDIDDNSTTEDNIVIRLIVQLLEHAQLGKYNPNQVVTLKHALFRISFHMRTHSDGLHQFQ